MLVSLLLACFSGSKEPEDTADDTAGDTAETGDSGDSADTGDSGTAMTESLVLGFDIGGAWEGSTLALTWLDATSFGTGTLRFGDVLWSGPASARVDLPWFQAPPAELLQDLDPVTYPGVKIAYFAPTLHLDTDGDGLPSADEGYLGTSLVWPLYVTGVRGVIGPLPDVVNGWNAVTIPFGANTQIALLDATHIALDASLVVDDTFDLAGTGAGRAALVSALALAGDDVATPTVWDGELGETWSIHVDGPPPADHYQYLDRPQVDGAVEVGLGYTDSDGSGGWSAGDATGDALCLGADAVGLVYLPRVTNIPLAMGLTYSGVSAGWVGARVNNASAPPPTDAEMATLTLGGTCAL